MIQLRSSSDQVRNGTKWFEKTWFSQLLCEQLFPIHRVVVFGFYYQVSLPVTCKRNFFHGHFEILLEKVLALK